MRTEFGRVAIPLAFAFLAACIVDDGGRETRRLANEVREHSQQAKSMSQSILREANEAETNAEEARELALCALMNEMTEECTALVARHMPPEPKPKPKPKQKVEIPDKCIEQMDAPSRRNWELQEAYWGDPCCTVTNTGDCVGAPSNFLACCLVEEEVFQPGSGGDFYYLPAGQEFDLDS